MLEGSPTTRWTTSLRTLMTTGKSETLRNWSAAFKDCSRIVMRSDSQQCLLLQRSPCLMDPGLRHWAQPGKMQDNERRIGTHARLTWLLKVQRISSPTYCSTSKAIGLLKPSVKAHCKPSGLAPQQLRGCEVREDLDGLYDFVLHYCGPHCAWKRWEIVGTVQTIPTVTKCSYSIVFPSRRITFGIPALQLRAGQKSLR